MFSSTLSHGLQMSAGFVAFWPRVSAVGVLFLDGSIWPKGVLRTVAVPVGTAGSGTVRVGRGICTHCPHQTVACPPWMYARAHRSPSASRSWSRAVEPGPPSDLACPLQDKPPLQRHRAHRAGQPEAALFHRPGWGDIPLHPELPTHLKAATPRGLQGKATATTHVMA